jgi:hypothetical protein
MMRKMVLCIVFCCTVVGISLFGNKQVEAADCRLNIQIARPDDGVICGELWYNSQLVWRLAVLNDGSRPVGGMYDARTILITPDIDQGMFFLRID